MHKGMRFLVIIFSFFILAELQYDKNLSIRNMGVLKKKSQQIKLPNSIYENSDIINAIIIGGNLSKEKKEKLKSLFIIHLITPSALHFSSLIYPLSFFKKSLPFITLLFMTLISFNLTGFYSLKRAAGFSFFKSLGLNSKHAFITIFIFEILFGNFTSSPMSYAYSLLFWGVIMFSPSRSLIQIVLSLLLAQSFLLYSNNQIISISSFLLGMVITFIFSFFYLFIWILYTLNTFFPIPELLNLVGKLLWSAIDYASLLSKMVPIYLSPLIFLIPYLGSKVYSFSALFTPLKSDKPPYAKSVPYYFIFCSLFFLC